MTIIEAQKTKGAASFEALSDTARELEARMSGDDVRGFFRDLDPRRIELSLQGLFVDPPLSHDELRVYGTGKRCIREYGVTPEEIVGVLALLDVAIQLGSVFEQQ